MAKTTKTDGKVTVTAGGIQEFKMDASAFQALGGERFSGMNVLKLNTNEAVQGLVISKIGIQKVKGRGKDKGKTREIPSYAATLGEGGKEYRLPLNASFVQKCDEAKIKIGDTIAVLKGEGYESKEGNKGVSFELLVQARKGK